jgi:tRNA (guanine37-N1)-methyltransferase
MQIDIITAFPEMVATPLRYSITGRAVSKNLVNIRVHDLRDWTNDKHRTIDDAPYGGGAGMVYKVEPLYKCLTELFEKSDIAKKEIILTSPRGEQFVHEKAVRLSFVDQLIIICGHYKGVDERIKSFFPIKEISIGDYVLSGGEIPALVIVDTLVRLVPGVLGDVNSAFTDSFTDYLLDCDNYTRPEVFKGQAVPQILLSGDHDEIDTWQLQQREEITRQKRPDLYKKYIKKVKIK